MNNYADTVTLLGVKIHTHTSKQVLEKVYSKLNLRTIKSPRKPVNTRENPTQREVLPIYTINPEFIVLAHEFPWFQNVLNNAFIAVPDGIGIVLSGLLTGKHIRTRVTGVELVSELTSLAYEHGFRTGFLGGKQGSARKTEEIFRKTYPNLSSWSDPGPRIEINKYPKHSKHPNSQYSISKLINIDHTNYDLTGLLHQIESTDILFVAFGAPKQELFIEWLKKYLTSYNLHHRSIVCVGVGGSFDEISGVTLRPPQWIQKIGVKWLFGLITEPWRWKRQIRLLKFSHLVLREVIGNR